MWLVTVLFGIYPYIALAVFIVGHVWRWKYDQFGWTTRTSELMEKRWLAWGSPLFHFGLLFVLAGHLMGLLIPASAMRVVGVTDEMYHVFALGAGILAGMVLVAGIVILILRRFVTKSRLRLVTRRADVVMYVLVAIVIAGGMSSTIGINLITGGFDYRSTISVWVRSLITFQPNLSVMTAIPWIYELHLTAAMTLFAVWPFTRLVHLWSIPLGYLTRPPIVYHTPARKPATSRPEAGTPPQR